MKSLDIFLEIHGKCQLHPDLANRQLDGIFVEKFDKGVYQFKNNLKFTIGSDQSNEDQNQEKSVASSEKRSLHSSKISSRESTVTSSRSMKDHMKEGR